MSDKEKKYYEEEVVVNDLEAIKKEMISVNILYVKKLFSRRPNCLRENTLALCKMLHNDFSVPIETIQESILDAFSEEDYVVFKRMCNEERAEWICLGVTDLRKYEDKVTIYQAMKQ